MTWVLTSINDDGQSDGADLCVKSWRLSHLVKDSQSTDLEARLRSVIDHRFGN